MSAHSQGEFERLLVAHGNRELSAAETRQLGVLARDDPARVREVREIDELHGLLDHERALWREAMTPLDLREEGDSVYRDLCRRAARAERALRDLAADQPPTVVLTPLLTPELAPRRRLTPSRLLLAGAAAAALLWVVSGLFGPTAPPEDHRLRRGGPGIVLRPEISATSHEISWHAVVGARTYDATIFDADDRIVLVRHQAASRSYVWQVSQEDYDSLARHPGPLYLRIVARDGAGIRIDTSGDLPLTVR